MQFGAVATAKNAHGRGLSRLLMEHVLQLYPNRPAYLAANEGVTDFYPKFGFRQVQTYTASICYSQKVFDTKSPRAVKLDIDDEIVTHTLNSRGAFSNLVDCTNAPSIQMFHFIMQYHDDIYHLPHLNTVVIAQQTSNNLFLADVISHNKITLDEILATLPCTGIDTIEFGFCPDWLGVTPNWTPTDMASNPFFIRGNWDLPEYFMFPATSET